jgi:uncharacterized protein YdhG (YjbR/CyaY superfamily)
MVSFPAATVDEYLAKLPEDRRAVVSAVRKMVKRHLPKGYVERAAWGMLGYLVPIAKSGPTYNDQPLCYAGIAAQKHHYSLYLTAAYMDPALTKQLQDAFKAEGKKLDMGKSCVRFKSLDAIPLEALGSIVAAVPMKQFIERYQAIHAATKTGVKKAAKAARATKRAKKTVKAARSK